MLPLSPKLILLFQQEKEHILDVMELKTYVIHNQFSIDMIHDGLVLTFVITGFNDLFKEIISLRYCVNFMTNCPNNQ